MRILVPEDDAAVTGFAGKGWESGYAAVDVSGDGEQVTDRGQGI